jgi:murein DD-endopeptidase MepM/ murein hydrolase activator NlpD
MALKAGCATCARRRAPRSAGRRDAVDLAGARLAHRHFGGRCDPFSGEPAFHQGLDISTDKGQPVYRDGRRHDRIGRVHRRVRQPRRPRSRLRPDDALRPLSALRVEAGPAVKRGAVIGYVGATGAHRVTLHYEIPANGS